MVRREQSAHHSTHQLRGVRSASRGSSSSSPRCQFSRATVLPADCTSDAAPSRRPSPRTSPRAGMLAVRPPVGPLVGRPRFFVPLSEEGVLAPWPRLALMPPPVSNPLRRSPSNPDLVAPDSFLRQRELEAARLQVRRAARSPPPRPVRQQRARMIPRQPLARGSPASRAGPRIPVSTHGPRPQWRSPMWLPTPATPARCALAAGQDTLYSHVLILILPRSRRLSGTALDSSLPATRPR